MKKVLISGAVALFAAVVIPAGLASAATSSGGIGSVDSKTKNIQKCQARIDKLVEFSSYLEKRKNARFAQPTDMSGYTQKTGKKVIGLTNAPTYYAEKATSGPNKGFTNYVVFNNRFENYKKTMDTLVYKSGDKKGKKALDTTELGKQLDESNFHLAGANNFFTDKSKHFVPGYTFKAGQNMIDATYRGFYTDADLNKEIKFGADFTVVYDKSKCNEQPYRFQISTMNRYMAVMKKSMKEVVNRAAADRKEVRTAYNGVVTQYNKERKNLVKG